MRALNCVVAAAALAGCAHQYEPPTRSATPATATVAAPPGTVMKAAQRVLVAEGFQVTNVSESAGTISTAMRDVRVTEDLVECGRVGVLGVDYLKDNRTRTRIAYGVVVVGASLTVRSQMEGEYLPSDPIHGLKLTCVSRGQLERELLVRIIAASGR